MTPTPSVTDDNSSFQSLASKHMLVDAPEDSALVIRVVLPSFAPEDSFSCNLLFQQLFSAAEHVSNVSFTPHWQKTLLMLLVIKQVATALHHSGVKRGKTICYTNQLTQHIDCTAYQWFQFVHYDDTMNILNLSDLLHKIKNAVDRAAPHGIHYKVAIHFHGEVNVFLHEIFTYELQEHKYFCAPESSAPTMAPASSLMVPITVPHHVPIVETIDEDSCNASLPLPTASMPSSNKNMPSATVFTPSMAIPSDPVAPPMVTPSPATTSMVSTAPAHISATQFLDDHGCHS